jgi:hypothetical protein
MGSILNNINPLVVGTFWLLSGIKLKVRSYAAEDLCKRNEGSIARFVWNIPYQNPAFGTKQLARSFNQVAV